MGILRHLSCLCLAAVCSNAVPTNVKAEPKGFLRELGNSTWVIGNNLWNVTQGRQYATKLLYKNTDLVGKAVGHYVSYNGAQSDLNWTSAAIVESGSNFINVQFTAKEGDFHWVIYNDLAGAYQYFINRALPVLGEFRTLWRLDNQTFPNGRTNIKDGVLPPLSEYVTATKVQDETWQKADGTYLTKYDWAAFVREQDYYGVYGDKFGSWYINPGKDYYNGDQLKQELMIHRESQTGDAVQLNMIHGTHFQAVSKDTFANGKTWGPWLWYLNDGSKEDAASRAVAETQAWPYSWFKDSAYQSRSSVEGKIILSDGRPASGAAVFLGDNASNLSALDQGKAYYYTTYTDNDGAFTFENVRTGSYGLQAWSNGGKLRDVYTDVNQSGITVQKTSRKIKLDPLRWQVTSQQNRIFQIGDFDRKTTGFNLSGPAPFEHGRISKCPANLTYNVGTSQPSDWCFGQSALGTYSIAFSIASIPSNATSAKLVVSLAGFSANKADVLLNAKKIGSIGGLAGSQDTYRGATRAGEWRYLEFASEKSDLKVGSSKVDFKVTSSAQWSGWLWDSIILEWV